MTFSDILVWCLANWQIFPAVYAAAVTIWQQAKGKAADVALKIAIEETTKLLAAQMSNAEKRKAAVDMTYNLAPLYVKKILTMQEFELAVETAYQLFVKNKQ